jgi:hypothetical protein
MAKYGATTYGANSSILTANDIFERACDLVSKRKRDGIIDATKTISYQVRTCGLLTLWQNEIQQEIGETLSSTLTELTDIITVKDKLSGAYFLAANFLLVEDPDSASFFQQRFEELKNRFINKQKSTEVDITDSYSWSSSGGW